MDPLAVLHETFSESDLLYRVGVLRLAAADPSFLDKIAVHWVGLPRNRGVT